MPLADGRVLSPHNVGCRCCCCRDSPSTGWSACRSSSLIAALTWALSYVLALRLSGARPRLVWLATLAVALSATAFSYSSEVYPEIPAGLALVGALLIVTGRERLSPSQVLALVLLLSALPWLGAKYAPLSALVALYVLWRAEPRGRAVLLAGGALSALGYAAFHLATYESLTPYNVNLVYAGGSTATIVGEHVEIGDRVCRLWGLLIDRPLRRRALGARAARDRAGAGAAGARRREAAPRVGPRRGAGADRDVRRDHDDGLVVPRPHAGDGLPAAADPACPRRLEGRGVWRTALVALGVYSLAVTAALAQAGRSREVAIALDPFEMQAGFFRGVAGLFPQYTSWTSETWLLTVAWLGLGGIALAVWAAWALRGWRPRVGRRGPPPPSEQSGAPFEEP